MGQGRLFIARAVVPYKKQRKCLNGTRLRFYHRAAAAWDAVATDRPRAKDRSVSGAGDHGCVRELHLFTFMCRVYSTPSFSIERVCFSRIRTTFLFPPKNWTRCRFLYRSRDGCSDGSQKSKESSNEMALAPCTVGSCGVSA